MKLLLDTHFVIWMAIAPDQLRPAETLALDRWRGNIFASVVSLWEIRTKWEAVDRRGQRKGVISPAAATEFLAGSDIAVDPLTHDVVLTSLAVDIDHTDPFDRMLLVHAQHRDARFMTRDRRLAHHPLSLPL